MSGWGFLSKAEGFLDRVLDEQSKDKSSTKKPNKTTGGDGTETPQRTSTPSTRWQERLTRAASQFTSTDSLNYGANLLADAADSSSTLANGTHPGVADRAPTSQSSRAEVLLPVVPGESHVESLTELQRSATFPANMPSSSFGALMLGAEVSAEKLESLRPSALGEFQDISDSRKSTETISNGDLPQVTSTAQTRPASVLEMQQIIDRLESDIRICEERRVDDSQFSAERISALEARLSYFSNEQISSNRDVLKLSGASAEQKTLAERDERIALLLEEGDNLSKKESQHLANVKRLRGRVTELEGLIATSLKAVEKAETEGTTIKRDNKNLAESLKRAEAKMKDMSRLETENSELRRDKQAQAKALVEVKRQLADADDTIAQNVTIWTQLQAEKSRSSSLQTRVGELLAEAKETAIDHASALEKLQGQLNRRNERYEITENERIAESTRLEVELEKARALLEETTTGAIENSQNKLLRQVEALQTQQTLARQNWARIEESLVLRSRHAEKERDELREQEDNLRQRLRQISIQRKEVEEDRNGAQGRCKVLESTIKDQRDHIESLEKAVVTLEASIEADRQSWRNERDTLLADLERQAQERLESERRNCPPSLPQSPYLGEMAGRAGYAFQKHVTESPNSRTPEKARRPGIGSRMSTQTSRMPTRRKASSSYLLDEMRSPPIGYREDEPFGSIDHFGNMKAPTEASLSTTSASASVGLMERVAANVRKLELEANGLREDLVRMSRQRDEARDECVELEAQAQQHRLLEQALSESQRANDQLRAKFDTTLELLGKETEENDQLKEDIKDMKAAFRETLQSKLGLP